MGQAHICGGIKRICLKLYSPYIYPCPSDICGIEIRRGVYKRIIQIEVMYIVFVPFDWTRALSSVCF